MIVHHCPEHDKESLLTTAKAIIEGDAAYNGIIIDKVSSCSELPNGECAPD
jgi:hypothetical protein